MENPSLQVNVFKIKPGNLRPTQRQVIEQMKDSLVSHSFGIGSFCYLFSKFLDSAFSRPLSVPYRRDELLIFDTNLPVNHAERISHVTETAKSREFSVHCCRLESSFYEALPVLQR